MKQNILEIIKVEFIKSNSGKMVARADIQFNGFQLKGFKILKNEHGKEYVTAPSYLSPLGWRQLFRTDNEEEWNNICQEVLSRFGDHSIKESLEESGI